MFKIFSYLCIVFLATYAVFLLGGARATTYWTDPRLIEERPAFLEPEQSPTAELREGERIFLRADAQRTGFTPEKIGLDLKLEALNEPRNLGIHNASKSSPVVLKDGSYFAATDAGRFSYFNSANKEMWRKQTYEARFGFHSTPAVFGSWVIIGDYSGLLAAYDTATGAPQWMIPLGHTVGSSPQIDDEGQLYVGVETQKDGFFIKLDARTGRLIWQSEWLGDQTHSSPALSLPLPELDGDRLVIAGDNASYLNALSARDGQFVWRLKTGGPLKGTPAIYDRRAYFSSWDRFLRAVDLISGKEVWKVDLGNENQSSAALLPTGDFGFIMTHRGFCRFRLGDQPDLACEKSTPGRATRQSSPVISLRADGHGYWVWASCDEKSFCAYDPISFRRVKAWELPSPVSGEARLQGGKIWLMSSGEGGLLRLAR